tara:strand:- start:1366 stop:1767 length:402 start_codon:yes stop_codon:yes gene_type:complete
MATVTYLGPQYSRAAFDGREWLRKVPREVSEQWVKDNAVHLRADCWQIEGVNLDDVPAPVVEKVEEVVEDTSPPASDDDGIPDSAWTRAQIREWLSGNGISVPRTYTTKAKLLSLVEEHLNPKPAEEQITETE